MEKYKGERNIEPIWKNPMSSSPTVVAHWPTMVLQASSDGGSRGGHGHATERHWWLNGWQRRVVTKRRRRKRRKKKKPMRKMKVGDFFVFERKMKLERWEGEGRFWSWMGKWERQLWGRGKVMVGKEEGWGSGKGNMGKGEGSRVKKWSGVIEKKLENSDNKKCRIRVK